MNDCDIYRILKIFPGSSVITSSELLKIHYLSKCGFSGLNSRVSELQNLGFVSAKMKDNEIYASLTPNGLNFVENHRYHLKLKRTEIFITFLLGFSSGFLISHVIPFLFSFIQ